MRRKIRKEKLSGSNIFRYDRFRHFRGHLKAKRLFSDREVEFIIRINSYENEISAILLSADADLIFV